MVSFGFSKRNFLALSHLFLISLCVSQQNSLKNSSKIVPSKVLPTSRCRDYAQQFHWCMHIFLLNSLYILNVEEGKLFSPSFKQHNNKESLATDLFERLNFEQSFFKIVFKETPCKISYKITYVKSRDRDPSRPRRDLRPSRPRLQTTVSRLQI